MAEGSILGTTNNYYADGFHITPAITGRQEKHMDKQEKVDAAPVDRVVRRGADRLAYAVARLVQSGRLDARSEAGDALLDYLQVGSIDGPQDVPTWMMEYEARDRIRSDVDMQVFLGIVPGERWPRPN